MERPKKEDAEKDTKKTPEDHVNPVKAFAKMILNMGLLNEKTPLERMKELSENRAKGNDKDEQFAKSLYESTVDFNPQIKRAIEERKPDLFILDHFLVPPCLPESGMPWLYLFSGNPIAIYSSITKDLPPFATGNLHKFFLFFKFNILIQFRLPDGWRSSGMGGVSGVPARECCLLYKIPATTVWNVWLWT